MGPKFIGGDKDSFSATWHWPAFFVPFLWLLYRKMYLWGVIAFVIQLILIFLILPFIGMIVFAICGNYIYYKHAKKKLLEIKKRSFLPSSTRAKNIARAGGTNIAIVIVFLMPILIILAVFAIHFIPPYKYAGCCRTTQSNLRDAYTASKGYFMDKPEGKIDNIGVLEPYGFRITNNVLIRIDKLSKNSGYMVASHPDCDKIYSIDIKGEVTEHGKDTDVIQKLKQPQKVEVPPPVASTIGVKEIARDGRFIAYSNGTVLDTKTNLMWAAKDNGSDINRKNAKSYCDDYRGGEYTDWRMPTQDELAGLYDRDSGYTPSCAGSGDTDKVHLTKLITLSCWWGWAYETLDWDWGSIPFSDAAYFNFYNGSRYWDRQSGTYDIGRALPVRSGK